MYNHSEIIAKIRPNIRGTSYYTDNELPNLAETPAPLLSTILHGLLFWIRNCAELAIMHNYV